MTATKTNSFTVCNSSLKYLTFTTCSNIAYLSTFLLYVVGELYMYADFAHDYDWSVGATTKNEFVCVGQRSVDCRKIHVATI